MKNCRISIYLYICEFCQFGGVEQWPWNGTVLKTILPLRTQRTERGWINWNKYDRGMNDLAESPFSGSMNVLFKKTQEHAQS